MYEAHSSKGRPNYSEKNPESRGQPPLHPSFRKLQFSEYCGENYMALPYLILTLLSIPYMKEIR